jgi:hypothetical protein
MTRLLDKYHYSSQSGIVGIFFLFIFLLLLLGADFGYVYFLEKCGDTPIGTCLSDDVTDEFQKSISAPTPTPILPPITAVGSFTVKKYTVYVTLNFPSQGGPVTGKVTGSCSASVTGEYSGGNNGEISGQVFGSCSPFFVPIPAKATFFGTVDQEQKIVPISGTGSAAGISGSGSLTLTF